MEGKGKDQRAGGRKRHKTGVGEERAHVVGHGKAGAKGNLRKVRNVDQHMCMRQEEPDSACVPLGWRNNHPLLEF